MEPGREDREHAKAGLIIQDLLNGAAMEPGREDREHPRPRNRGRIPSQGLQWNPAVKTGSTGNAHRAALGHGVQLQWNPAVKTGSTPAPVARAPADTAWLQWNPAVKTGSTHEVHCVVDAGAEAAMEPGREDREHLMQAVASALVAANAAMEPGREDREHRPGTLDRHPVQSGLQWNPAVKTGSTVWCRGRRDAPHWLQWNPAVKTGSTVAVCRGFSCRRRGCNGTRP